MSRRYFRLPARAPLRAWLTSGFLFSLFLAMHDMLVRLCRLPDAAGLYAQLAEQGVRVRRCNPFEAHILEAWVGRNFSARWVNEARVAMSRQPSGCMIATREGRIIAFACYDATARGFVGPMGVQDDCRGAGVGKAVLLAALEQMRALGYVYAIIGGVGPADFYKKAVGATDIEDSAPGIYEDILPEIL